MSFETSINSLTVLHCSCPSKNVRRILAGGCACHSAFGATSRCDFLQCRYQCMWERTSLAKRQAFQRGSDLFLRSLSCRLASNWNHKLQSTSICMSSHAQNLTSSNVHSCQCQNCSCSELLHASSWFPFAAQCSAGVCWMGLTFEAFSPIWSASTRHWALARLDSKGFKTRTMFYDNAWYDRHKEILFGQISDPEAFFVARKRVACGKPLCNAWSSTVTSMLTCWVSMQRFRPVKRPESGTGPWIKSTNWRNLDPRPIRCDLNVSRSSNNLWFVVICQFVCQFMLLFIHLRKY